MPCGAGSRRTASVIAHPAAYAGLPEPAEGSQDRTDSTLSTAPPPFASMTGANARTVPSVPAWVENPPSLTSTVASPAAVAAAAAESGAWRCRGSRARSRARRRLGERWTFLILREAPWDTSRFADLRARLGVAPDTLSNPYRVPGARQLPPQARVARGGGAREAWAGYRSSAWRSGRGCLARGSLVSVGVGGRRGGGCAWLAARARLAGLRRPGVGVGCRCSLIMEDGR